MLADQALWNLVIGCAWTAIGATLFVTMRRIVDLRGSWFPTVWVTSILATGGVFLLEGLTEGSPGASLHRGGLHAVTALLSVASAIGLGFLAPKVVLRLNRRGPPAVDHAPTSGKREPEPEPLLEPAATPVDALVTPASTATTTPEVVFPDDEALERAVRAALATAFTLDAEGRSTIALHAEPRQRTAVASNTTTMPGVLRAPAPVVAGRATVLVIDDNCDMNDFVTEALSELFQVARAYDTREGLEKARSQRPDAIVMSVTLPGERALGAHQASGGDLIDRLRADTILRAIPVLVIAGRADDELRMRMLEKGAIDYLTKPLAPAEIRARVRPLVSSKRATDALRDVIETRAEDLETMALEVRARLQQLLDDRASFEAARDDAIHAHARKSTFLSHFSLEARVPLTALQLLLERLDSIRPQISEAQWPIVEGLTTSAARLSDLVDALLLFARHDNIGGAGSADRPPCDLFGITEDAVTSQRPRATRRAIELVLAQGPGKLLVNGNPLLVRLVIGDLLASALASTTDDRISVSLTTDGDRCLVRVTDATRDAEASEVSNSLPRFALAREIMHGLGGKITVEAFEETGRTFTAAFAR